MKEPLKKLFILLLLSGVLVACSTGNSSENSNDNNSDSNTQVDDNNNNATDPTKEPEPTDEPETVVENKPYSGELVVALTTQPNSLIPPNPAERNARNASQSMFNGLTWVDDAGNIVPDLATSWEVSEDGTEYIFTLREDVLFHNGTTFEAKDFVASWELGKDDRNAYAFEYKSMVEVEAIDDYTLRIVTEEVDALFLRKLSWMGVMPSEYIAEVGLEGLERHPIGTGPFMFVEWIQGDRIVMEANPNYHEEGLPKVERLIFRPITESSTRVAAVQTGEVHIATRLSIEEADSLKNAENINVIEYPVTRVYYIAFNNLSTGIGQPTEDVLVRRAMNYAVDRQAIVNALFGGFPTLATGLIAPGELGFNSSIDPYPYDPDMARELLAEAGYPDGFEIEMACPIDAYTNFEQVCEAVGGYLQDVGITLVGDQVQFMESGQYWDLEANKELPPLFGDSWSAGEGEALRRLEGSLMADASYAAWAEPTITDYITSIFTAVDPEERATIYSELHQYMYDNPPFIYLYVPNTFEAVNKAVEGYKPRSAEEYFLKSVSVNN